VSEWDGYFDWDEGNEDHATRHGVEVYEIEEALLDPGGVTGEAYGVGSERREAVIGETYHGRIVFVVYTMRDDRVRPVSAREATDKEKRRYRR
jgi:uncharacterized protein